VRTFDSQEAVGAAFKAGELHRDVIVVVRGQGPRANGMPELHKLTPALSALQAKGHKVALVTDGRMSGASGTVPAAIHVSPEAHCGGPAGEAPRWRCGEARQQCREPRGAGQRGSLAQRTVESPPSHSQFGMGRELFALFRTHATSAEQGGGICTPPP